VQLVIRVFVGKSERPALNSSFRSEPGGEGDRGTQRGVGDELGKNVNDRTTHRGNAFSKDVSLKPREKRPSEEGSQGFLKRKTFVSLNESLKEPGSLPRENSPSLAHGGQDLRLRLSTLSLLESNRYFKGGTKEPFSLAFAGGSKSLSSPQ